MEGLDLPSCARTRPQWAPHPPSSPSRQQLAPTATSRHPPWFSPKTHKMCLLFVVFISGRAPPLTRIGATLKRGGCPPIYAPTSHSCLAQPSSSPTWSMVPSPPSSPPPPSSRIYPTVILLSPLKDSSRKPPPKLRTLILTSLKVEKEDHVFLARLGTKVQMRWDLKSLEQYF